VGKGLGVLVDASLAVKGSVPVVAKKSNNVLGGVAGRFREVILPLYTAPVKFCLECSAQCWALQRERCGYTEVSLA